MKRTCKYFQVKISKACMFVLNITLLPFSIIVYLIFYLLGVRQSKSFSHYVTSPASLQNKKKWKTRTKDPFSATYSQYWEDLMRFFFSYSSSFQTQSLSVALPRHTLCWTSLFVSYLRLKLSSQLCSFLYPQLAATVNS